MGSRRPSGPGTSANRQRGLVYWDNGPAAIAGSSPVSVSILYALNAKSGELIRTFGQNGSLHLSTGVELDGGQQANITLNTPGVIYKDMYIVGGNTNTPGAIRAYDVRTGAMQWIFHTIPRPGEFGYDTWPPDAYKNPTIGAASNWTGAALDEARGIVYVPTEEATPDIWGAERDGANLFANTLLALDANTGKRLWHYQIVHHDSERQGPADAARAADRHAERPAHRRGRARHEARTALRLRSRDRPAAVADRGTSGAADRSARREDVADAAVSDEAGAAHATALHAQATCRTSRPSANR